MTIYVHYNGYDFVAPDGQSDRWVNYCNPDSAKMFFVCRDSWKQNGWNPVRLNSSKVRGFQFTGILSQIELPYPVQCWDVWFQLEKLAPCWWVTTDVINYGFTPGNASELLRSIPTTNDYGTDDPLACGPYWTHSLCYVTPQFCRDVIRLIHGVDSGKIPLPKCSVISDESIVRDHWGHFLRKADIVGFGPLNNLPGAKLQHYPRSSLQRGLEQS